MGLSGSLVWRGDEEEWQLEIRSERGTIAVVRGSRAYVLRGLLAAGLAAPVAWLLKDRRRWKRALVCSQPANGNTQGTGEADECSGFYARSSLALLKPGELTRIHEGSRRNGRLRQT